MENKSFRIPLGSSLTEQIFKTASIGLAKGKKNLTTYSWRNSKEQYCKPGIFILNFGIWKVKDKEKMKTGVTLFLFKDKVEIFRENLFTDKPRPG